MICKYCGLESDEATNHGSPEACITALERELARLRQVLSNGAFAIPAAESGREPLDRAQVLHRRASNS